MAPDKDSAPRSELTAASLSTEADLVRFVEDMPAAKLVEIWNGLPGVTPVQKFTDRKTAVRRIWTVVQAMAVTPKPSETPKPKSPTANTKAEQVIALLRRPGGATLEELMQATSWQAHSIRGFISGQLTKKLRLKVKSFKRDGQRVYKIR